jgi:hypothetical protein
MVARQIFDKLPALPPAIKCDAESFDNPVENSPKRRRLTCSECRACLGLRTARHVKLLTGSSYLSLLVPLPPPDNRPAMWLGVLRLAVTERPILLGDFQEVEENVLWP